MYIPRYIQYSVYKIKCPRHDTAPYRGHVACNASIYKVWNLRRYTGCWQRESSLKPAFHSLWHPPLAARNTASMSTDGNRAPLPPALPTLGCVTVTGHHGNTVLPPAEIHGPLLLGLFSSPGPFAQVTGGTFAVTALSAHSRAILPHITWLHMPREKKGRPSCHNVSAHGPFGESAITNPSPSIIANITLPFLLPMPTNARAGSPSHPYP
ncbi:hypothetical protein B0T26DRAFT_210369 [Lasiosphaeria miniovina]|uniref:Uncharacterized protein n=1 Tax=Lasiosphaeria miniovina TaxID=1954250 RepID=A0AA40E274_9PEZI|nr:uncharacterized protein B0T26DRAFT_210369 [Lasiosphaeria miniovina]KAK0722257.1 hypothetical protein B0T26DRAFT_210369 [Lasiosphaeria miniovina]